MKPSTRIPVCSEDVHEWAKLDVDVFRAVTTPVGVQDMGEFGALELANCLCGSTLARPVRP